MITVHITCNTGKTWTTGFNGTFAEAENYFLGTTFTDEAHDGTETRNKCIAIKLLPPRPQQHEIDAKVQQALEVKMQNQYRGAIIGNHKPCATAVVGLSTTIDGDTSLGFHFDDNRSIGEMFHFPDGTLFEVLALV